MDADLARLRREYVGAALTVADAGTDPMGLFARWFDAARAGAGTVGDIVGEPSAMTLSTVGPGRRPSARMVLLKGIAEATARFIWFTNLDSRKGRESAPPALAALTFWWPVQHRQVRVVGPVAALGGAASDAYFAGRPRGSQLAAAASCQSACVRSRADLESAVARMGEGPVERPARWGGMSIEADEIEFWQGRPSRLHDRVVFLRTGQDGLPVSDAAVEAAGGRALVEACGTLVRDPAGNEWLRARLQP